MAFSRKQYSHLLSSLKFLTLLIALNLASSSAGQEIPAAPPATTDPFLTVAESSAYTATSRFDDVVAFIDRCARQSEHVQRIDFGETVEGRPMVAAVVGNPLPTGQTVPSADDDQRIVCLLLGNIHSGECAGKEALLELLRELSQNGDSQLLEKMVLIFVPNYNADANERIGPGQYHRPGQLGPEQGMGLRENAQQLDLNRDFVKMEAPETRSLVRLMNQYDVDLFIDCHTTNGSKHRYDLTYDYPHNPAVFPGIKQFLLSELLPTVTKGLSQEKKIETFFYGNFDREQTEWRTFGYEGRYSTEHAGLCNRIGILSEAYSYVSYKRRIEASREFVRSCLQYAAEHVDRIRQVRAEAKAWGNNAFQKNEALAMSASLEAFPETVDIKAYKDDTPANVTVKWFSNFRPDQKAALPYAYLIPQEYSQVVDRMVMQGIEVQQLTEPLRAEVLIDRCVKINRADWAFQGHQMTSLETTRRSEVRDIPARTYVVSVNQPFVRLLATLLEPNSVDSFYTWNFFDDQLTEGKDLPVFRIDESMDLPLSAAVLRVEPSELLTLSKIDGPVGQINLESSVVANPQWYDENNYLLDWNRRRQLVDVKSGAMRPFTESNPPGSVYASFQKHLKGQDAAKPEMQPKISQANAQLTYSDDRTKVLLQFANDLYLGSGSPMAFRELTADKQLKTLVRFSPDGKWVSFVDSQHNLVAVSTTEKKRINFTSDGGPKIFNGRLDWVYQEELYGRGNFNGYWWNPNSTHIAFLRLDESKVPQYDVVDHLPRHNQLLPMAYPKAGDPNPEVRLGIADLGGQVQWTEFPKNDEVLVSNVTWEPSGENVVYQLQNRQQTWLDLCRVPAFGGPSATLIQDKTEAWIESPGAPTYLKDGSFLWVSPRSGTRKIYHYTAGGKLLNELTDDEFEVLEILGVSPDQDLVFFSSCYPSPTEVHVYRIALAGGMATRLTSLGSSHKVTFNPTFAYFIDEASSVTDPRRIELRSSNGDRLRILEARIDDRLKYLKINPPELIKVPTADGGSLEAHLIRPADFDSSKKYPVLLHVYSGPQTPKVKNEFAGRTYLWHQYLAQQGICVWICDNRSATRNPTRQAWPIHKNLGQRELDDIHEGIQWLTDQSWVDPKQLGIWGWSYGGYMTAYAMTHSNRFKVGISGAPVTDWRNYDSIYTERYMGLPAENLEGYQKSSVVEAANNLSGKLLLIHGGVDDNVHINNTMQLAKALQEAGKLFQMMIYPANQHAIRDQEQERHLRQTMTQFLLQNLQPIEGN